LNILSLGLPVAAVGPKAIRAAKTLSRFGKTVTKTAKGADRAADVARTAKVTSRANKLDDVAGFTRSTGKVAHTDDVFDGTTNQFRVLNECFSRETPVATPAGPKAIGEIEPGELVFAHDFRTGQWLSRRVLERHDSLYNGPLVAITTDGGTIQTTLYHPFWVLRGSDLHERPTPRELADHEDQGLSLQGRWVNSHELRAGDVLIGRDGSPQIVLHIAQQYEELYPVSNLTIEENHTFAVGPDAILVHNTAGCPRAADMPTPFSHNHHTIPKEIQKKLPKHLQKDPDIIGRRGLPNRRPVDPNRHIKEIHNKTGISTKETGIHGGAYNKRFDDEIEKRGGYHKMTKKKVLEIRDMLVKEFGI